MASDETARFDAGVDKDEFAEKAAGDPAALASVIDALSGSNRRNRQHAALVVHALAIRKPVVLRPYAEALADALERPESQTRWEILGALEKLVGEDARMIDRALGGITTALHDSESGVVRLAAFRVLSAYGSTTARRSERVWPLIDEAIRVYHGDPEFPAMLSGVVRLVSGGAADSVKAAAAERMEFDAEHTKGLVGRRAKRIVECTPKTETHASSS
jgi:hypothetical protein